MITEIELQEVTTGPQSRSDNIVPVPDLYSTKLESSRILSNTKRLCTEKIRQSDTITNLIHTLNRAPRIITVFGRDPIHLEPILYHAEELENNINHHREHAQLVNQFHTNNRNREARWNLLRDQAKKVRGNLVLKTIQE
jgi:hypothetical protein